MTKITDITSLRANSKDLDADLKAVFEKYGLSITRRTGNIGTTEVTFKVVAALAVGEDLGKLEQQKFNDYGKMLGIDPSYYGRSFRLGSRVFKVIGLDTTSRRSKRVKIARQPDGRTFIAEAFQFTERNLVP